MLSQADREAQRAQVALTFDRRLTVKRPQKVSDGMGGDILTHQDAGQFDCSITYSFGRDRVARDSVLASTDAICFVDPAYTPGADDQVEIDGIVFSIIYVRPSESGAYRRLYLKK